MPFAPHADLTLHYDDLGPQDGPVVALLAGAGRPASDYDALFCDPLLAAGFRLLRIDARDTGASSNFSATPPSLVAQRQGAAPVYQVADMAEDLRAVLDHAGVASAHLIGRSLGAQVAQSFAISAPERVKSLGLIMPASRSVSDNVADAVLERLDSEAVTSFDDYLTRQIRTVAAYGLPQDQDPARVEAEARTAWERGIPLGGTARHFGAGLALPDLRPALATLSLPVLILHGAQDKLIPPRFAEETAAALAAAKPAPILEIWPEMGHDGPPRLRQAWGARFAAWLAGL